jgi:heparin binding hemagglutinin HbhA
MTEQNRNTRIPTPIYAAAGAGDIAYQQLRKLPTVVGELSGRALAGGLELRERAIAQWRTANGRATDTASTVRERATGTASTLRKADLDALREQARRGTTALAHEARERANAVYTALVAHGERVIGTGIVGTADAVNADIEATEPKKAVGGAADGRPAPARAKKSTSAKAE